MRVTVLAISALILLGACSDSPMDDQGEDEVTAIEKQIEGDAKSLESAADEAVRELQSEIESELSDDGIVTQRVNTPQDEQ